MGVRLYVSATDAQIEKFVGATPGIIATCKGIMDAWYALADSADQDGSHISYQQANDEIARIDPQGAYALSSHSEPFGYAAIHREDPEGTYGGSAKGAAAVRALLLQRDRYGKDARFGDDAAHLRALCDRVALACADGRLEGVWWG